MSIRQELLALQAKHPLLKAETVVGWAKAHPASKLHQAIEWDDAVAGAEYRLWQVRQLIAVHIINEKGERQLLSLSIDRTSKGGGYRSIETIMSAPEMREVLLTDALLELNRIKQKYELLTELAKVWEAIEAAAPRRKRSKAGEAERSVAGRSKARPGEARLA